MKNDSLEKALSANFRLYYGKLYSALLDRFGTAYVQEIEDALQNAFLKAIKTWKPDRVPQNPEGWLYTVAKNDLLNQIKKMKRQSQESILSEDKGSGPIEDLRLKTLLFLAMKEELSYAAKVLFILKNVFGLHVREISESTLLSEEAIYKQVSRARKKLLDSSSVDLFETTFERVQEEHLALVEETLHAVFTIGFDTFDEKVASIMNEDVCVEALALTRLLHDTYQLPSTQNLLALICFHLARIPARIENGGLVPLQQQKKEKWNQELIGLGFQFLTKPVDFDPYYLEALITSKHMMTDSFDQTHWEDIVGLYKFWLGHLESPLLKLNLSYGLHQAGRREEAMVILNELKGQLPEDHFYLSVVRAEIQQASASSESREILQGLVENMNQQARKEFLLNKINQHT